MLFKPVQLGREALDKDVLIADRKSCKRFGPCGVGEKALYLSSEWSQDRRRIFHSSVRNMQSCLSQRDTSKTKYLVVEYDGGREKQCTYKYEEQVDQLLAYLKRVRPEIKQVSAAAEVRLEERVREQPLDRFQGLFGGIGPTLLHAAPHPPEDDGVGVTSREGEGGSPPRFLSSNTPKVCPSTRY